MYVQKGSEILLHTLALIIESRRPLLWPQLWKNLDLLMFRVSLDLPCDPTALISEEGHVGSGGPDAKDSSRYHGGRPNDAEFAEIRSTSRRNTECVTNVFTTSQLIRHSWAKTRCRGNVLLFVSYSSIYCETFLKCLCKYLLLVMG